MNNKIRKSDKRITIIGLIIYLILCIVIIFIIASLYGCTVKEEKEPDIQKYAQEQAESDWFDYSYEIIENYDENGEKRYHITYYYSMVGYNGIIEYIVTYENGNWKKEVIYRK